jgi:hypothetical protein
VPGRRAGDMGRRHQSGTAPGRALRQSLDSFHRMRREAEQAGHRPRPGGRRRPAGVRSPAGGRRTRPGRPPRPGYGRICASAAGYRAGAVGSNRAP